MLPADRIESDRRAGLLDRIHQFSAEIGLTAVNDMGRGRKYRLMVLGQRQNPSSCRIPGRDPRSPIRTNDTKFIE